MPARKWTNQQIRDAAARIQAGEDRDQVAASQGMTWSQLYIAAWKRGLFIGRPEARQIGRSQLEAAWEAMLAGQHPQQAADSLGITRERMGVLMRRAGLKTRWAASRWRCSNWGETIYRMRSQGASSREICAELGITYRRSISAKLRDHMLKYCARVHLKVPTVVGQGRTRRVVQRDTPAEWTGAFDDRGVPLRPTSRGMPHRKNRAKVPQKAVCVEV